tara:strand:+ start:200 stop:1039 length:840 start_codon:yes stop_codon:yes gene_type:complete
MISDYLHQPSLEALQEAAAFEQGASPLEVAVADAPLTNGKALGRSYSAFTLIELLVVISITSLLMAILLPALSGARKAAMDTEAMANLRSITQGIMMYSMDFDGAVPVGFRPDWPTQYLFEKETTPPWNGPTALGLAITGNYADSELFYKDDHTHITKTRFDERFGTGPSSFPGTWGIQSNWCYAHLLTTDVGLPTETQHRELKMEFNDPNTVLVMPWQGTIDLGPGVHPMNIYVGSGMGLLLGFNDGHVAISGENDLAMYNNVLTPEQCFLNVDANHP